MQLAVGAILGAALGAWFASSDQLGHFELAPGFLTAPMTLCLALWIALSLYWSIAARRAAATVAAESGSSRALHLVLVQVAQILCFWPFAGWPSPAPLLLQFPRVLPETAWLPPLGLALAGLGLFVALWARARLGRNWSGEVSVKRDHELVRSGPYRSVRHPIYTGLTLMYVGTALVSGRLQGPIALLLVAVAYTRKIGMEERNLHGLFGSAWEDYRRDSWALLPGIL